jgi:hypothetical protein
MKHVFAIRETKQWIEHLINKCALLQTQRELLKSSVLKFGNWPANKYELIKNHQKSFLDFINSLDLNQL